MNLRWHVDGFIVGSMMFEMSHFVNEIAPLIFAVCGSSWSPPFCAKNDACCW